MDEVALVLAQPPIAQAGNGASGLGDERVAGRDQVQELGRALEVLDDGRQLVGLLEILAGLTSPLDLRMIHLLPGAVIAHGLEGDIGPAQQIPGHLGRNLIVARQRVDRGDLLLV